MAGGQISPFPIDFDRRPYNTLALSYECVIYSHACTVHVVLPLMKLFNQLLFQQSLSSDQHTAVPMAGQP